MLTVNIDHIPGREFTILGLVTGSTIQSKHIGSDIGQSFKTIVGGELKAYTAMMEKARNVATQRMEEAAHKLGADAVVNVRYSSSTVAAGAAEILCYGTAVKLV